MKLVALALLALAVAGCSKRDPGEAGPIDASVASTASSTPAATSSAPRAPRVDEAPGDTPALQDAERRWFADAGHKPKPAPGFPGARVLGGCTAGPSRPGFTALVCAMPSVELFYIQRSLLKQDGWAIEAQKRFAGTSYSLEATKGKAKLLFESSLSHPELGAGTATLMLRGGP